MTALCSNRDARFVLLLAMIFEGCHGCGTHHAAVPHAGLRARHTARILTTT
jgi:hypothetical protein